MSIKKFFLLPFIGALIACGNVEDEIETPSTSGNIEHFTLNAIYEGKEYHVPCILLSDKDSIIFLNEQFKDLFVNEISKLPNLVCDIKNDSTVEYKNEIIQAPDCEVYSPTEENEQTRGSSDETYVQFFKDFKYKGSSQKITLTEKYRKWEIPSLEHIKWSNAISSIKAYNRQKNLITTDVYLLAYDQNLFKGHVLRYKLYRRIPEKDDHSYVELPDLRKIPLEDGTNWNDKIISMKFYY